ncbi:hypothetical protein ACWD5Q_34670 [Streptomyces sp. NPDC002513]
MATTVLDPTFPAGAARRAPWRSPVDQPAYARPALLVITVLAAVFYAWGINHSQYHTFYANAARSMTESWKAFFYGSFDPGNSITLDKLGSPAACVGALTSPDTGNTPSPAIL